MTNLCEPWSIVLVPRPLTPFAAFAWYAMSELLPSGGLVRAKCFFRWVDATRPRGQLYSPHGVMLNLNADRRILEHELLKWLKCGLLLVGVPRESNSKSRTVRNFVFQGGHCQGRLQGSWHLWETWFNDLSSSAQSPRAALELSSFFFRSLVESKTDPFKTKVDFPSLPSKKEQAILPKIASTLNVTIPVVKKRKKDAKSHRKAIDYSIQPLSEKEIFKLVGQHVLIAVGGPSGSGKSTLVPSLLIEMRNVINSLQTRGGEWQKLNLAVDVSSLDAATPVADSVILSKARSREKMRALKREWTLDLAREAVAESEEKLARANIVLADLPGKVTDITESLSAFVTFGGIVTNDWEKLQKEWRKYFEHIKAPILFEVMSSRASSLVTTYDPGVKMMGRINRLDRVVRGWDPFVLTLAQFLLFDILPKRLGRPVNQPIDRREREDDCITVRF